MRTEIEQAEPRDVDELIRLLQQNQLPTGGFRDHLATALVARYGGRIVGSAELEVYPDGALLRSVAVAPDLQGRGVGHDLSDAAVRLARELQVPAVYLLTTTAEPFFRNFGFERIARADVPASVQTSIEFTSACPSSATVMRKPLSSVMTDGPLRVLFLCAGNAARSQMAEALLRHLSNERVDVFSAGTDPGRRIHPLAIETLEQQYGIHASGLQPKSIRRFLDERFDFVITVCDHAAESCPVFPGGAERIHWSFEDPAAVEDPDDQRRAFEEVAKGLVTRLRTWMSLPAIRDRMGRVGTDDPL
jgi:protein-tyrosine-phosphatase/N-acetylglutamate synthase-like GNAT family acetyltransferase